MDVNTMHSAWLQLSLCIARKERERAFGVWTLLAVHLPQVVALQIKGDMHMVFQENDLAARCYAQVGSFLSCPDGV